MCVEIMDGKMKNEVFTSCWVSRPGPNMAPSKWSQRRHLPLKSEEEAFKPWRPDVGKGRKDFHEQKRNFSKLAQKGLLIESDGRKNTNKKRRNGDRFSEEPRPQGAMAPGNTTQYLMDMAYNDLPESSVMYRAHTASCEKYLCNYASRSPGNMCVSDENDCVSDENDYESSLAFQQAEFEEAFRHFGSDPE